MSNKEPLAMETRIDAALFGRRYWTGRAWWTADPDSEVVARENYWEPGEGDRSREISPAEAATRDRVLSLQPFTTDWRLIPLLLQTFAERDRDTALFSYFAHSARWLVELRDSNGCTFSGAGDSQPLALCRAIVAVLDALEKTTKARDA